MDVATDFLNSVLNLISQSLTIPVIIILLIIVIISVILLGGLISEYLLRRKENNEDTVEIIYKLTNNNSINELKDTISNLTIKKEVKDLLIEITNTENLNKPTREALARKLVEAEEEKIDSRLAKSDTVTKIGPTLGLMGTLIPLGPGLASLGTGNIDLLAQALTIAFNTTIIGIGSGALCYVISKIRRGWYDKDISDLDALSDVVLDFMNSRD